MATTVAKSWPVYGTEISKCTKGGRSFSTNFYKDKTIHESDLIV